MEKKKIDKDTEVKELTSKWETLSRDSAIISAAIQYKKSKEIISKKLDNEKVAINYGINSVNKKVLENLKKYNEVENELKEIMEHYEKNLLELSSFYDSSIVINYAKIVEEEKKQIDMYAKVYELRKDEEKAKSKVDNSDDDIREEICNIEDEISKSELKVRRLKPTVKKKIEEKEKNITIAMETKEQQLQRDVKGPKVFSRATKFFLGKINPYKMIEKNVFSKIKSRIELYENEEKPKMRKVNDKYKEENIINTINEIIALKEEVEETEE